MSRQPTPKRPGSVATGSGQRLLGLGGKRADQISRRGQLGDEVDRLAGPHRMLGQLASGYGLLIGLLIGLLGSRVGRKLVFPAPPSVEEGVTQGASRIF